MLVGNIRTIVNPEGGFWGAANNLSTLFYTKQEFNRLVDTGLLEFTSPYQKLFGVFDVLKLQRNFKYKTRWFDIKASWQPFKACSFDPNGKIVENDSEVVPCHGMLNMEQCPTDWINSCYASLVEWRNGSISEDALNEVMARVMNLVGRAALMAAMDVLTCGKLYTAFDNYALNPDMSSSEVADWNKQLALCNGWLYTLIRTGEEKGIAPLQAHDIIEDSFNATTGDLTGSFEAVYDAALSRSSVRLKNAVYHGSLVSSTTERYPVLLVDNYSYQAMVGEYNAQCRNVNCTTMRLAKTVEQVDGKRVDVYRIDNTVIAPVLNTADWDNSTKGTTHFAVLTVTGNIQLGSSLDILNDAMLDGEAVLSIYRDPDPSNPKIKITSYALFGTAIADPDLATAAIVHITKA